MLEVGAGGVVEGRGLGEFGEGWSGRARVFVLVKEEGGCFFVVNISIRLVEGLTGLLVRTVEGG